MGPPNVCSSLKSCGGMLVRRSTRRPPNDLHHNVLGESKVAANQTIGEALLVLRKHHLRLPVGWALSLLTAWEDASRAAKPDLTGPE